MEKVSIAEGVNWATRASRQATAVHQGISCSEVSDVALSTDADSDYDEFPAGGSFYVFLVALAWSYVSSKELSVRTQFTFAGQVARNVKVEK